ncbi:MULTISPECIES: BREX-2 system phosphatase PglZ [Streptomyces]|uniref:BREX-2 system phosphatase PglZ n=1 Tax=Streptomyces TaxID=1883 RepID=UPI00069AEF91|nr:BREX-2 system phosphatase PglZ [Streptomyces sp. SID7805]MYU55015.1 BREX-2 system phosphatase PglZ [Streptomyces sp. SID7805]
MPQVGRGVARLTPTAVANYLAGQRALLKGPQQPDGDTRQVVLLRSAPVWEEQAILPWNGGRSARVAAAPSVLAVYQEALSHLDAPGSVEDPSLLVLLTDREDAELDPGILVRAYQHAIQHVDNWDLIRETFTASGIDPRLSDETWGVAEALLEAAPAGGWPGLNRQVLSRTHALTALARRRLLLDGDAQLDIDTLLLWSRTPSEGPRAYRALRDGERAGLRCFLAEVDQAGPTADALLSITEHDEPSVALPFGLVAAALWQHAPAGPEVFRARGRAENILGREFTDEAMRRYGESTENLVARNAQLLAEITPDAERLAGHLGAIEAVRHSPYLPAGLEARLAAVGTAIAGRDLDACRSALRAVQAHHLAETARTRIGRARMAVRLVQWLATEPVWTPDTVAGALAHYNAELSWADRALEHLEAGGDTESALSSAYDGLAADVRKVRYRMDRAFAEQVVEWTTAGTAPGSMLTVETFLERVAKPVVKSQRRLMLLVVDGMSAALAGQLGEELAANWTEYDPTGEKGMPPARQAMAAALPTVTGVSRTSLLTGKLQRGDQKTEKRVFPSLRLWSGQKAAVFHKDDLRPAGTGGRFGPDLESALADDASHLAVVLNTVDDSLKNDERLDEWDWTIDDIDALTPLLDEARRRGMAVLITSDHGHVLEHRGVKVPTPEAVNARYRDVPDGGAEPLVSEEETVLAGPRVVGGPIVALWPADTRYTNRAAGYHGGVHPAEFTIPVLAYLPDGATENIPPGWRQLTDTYEPHWWKLDTTRLRATSAPLSAETGTTQLTKFRRTPKKPAPQDAGLFEIAVSPHLSETKGTLLSVQAQSPVEQLLDDLFASPAFSDQLALLPRKQAPERLRQALAALCENNTLPLTAVAAAADMPPARARGYAAVLTQLLNMDGVQVLELLPDNKTLRLNPAWLRAQFGLGE